MHADRIADFYRTTRHRLTWLHAAAAVLGVFGVILTGGPAFAAQSNNAYISRVARHYDRVRPDEDGFNVMNVQLILGSSLTFSNPGAKPLDLKITTWRGGSVKTIHIAPHAHASWKPTHFGVYDYFNAKTTGFGSIPLKGAHDIKVNQPVARKGSKEFPLAAYGVVVVTNRSGGGIALSRSHGSAEISDAGASARIRAHAFMKHGPWIEVTDSTMTFKPWVLIVKAGQPIHVYNEDDMRHSFYPGDYQVMYKDHHDVHFYRYSFNGLILKKNGGHESVTFHHVGIHHIMCFIHAIAWKRTYKPYGMYGGFPYVMDAVVVVEPKDQANG